MYNSFLIYRFALIKQTTMYTIIFNGTVNTVNTIEQYNLAIMSILYDNKDFEAVKCLHTNTAIIKPII